MELAGKVALITGGGTGLGREVSLRLAEEGMKIVVSYSRSKEEAEQTANDILKLGMEAIALQADLRRSGECTRLVEETLQACGQIDLLIHNAATTRFVAFTDLDSIDEEVWNELLNLNTKAAFFLAKAAAPSLKKTKGQIITTSSVAGIAPLGSSLPYSVSKAALIHLTKCLAVALAPEVRVNSVAPGLLLTRWVAGFSESQLEKSSQSALLQKETKVSDAASAFVMLAKNQSCTGQVIVIDSGLLLS